jgi:hypothetical protein
MHLAKDLKEFIALLNANEAEYVIVGAHALAWHGTPRFTGDIDFLVRPSPENARRVESAMHQFGFPALTASDFVAEDSIVQLGYPPNRIDILTSISGCSFDEVWAGKVRGQMDGLLVNFIGRTEFKTNKLASGRPKDMADLDSLE